MNLCNICTSSPGPLTAGADDFAEARDADATG
jgi:hypothetical protein